MTTAKLLPDRQRVSGPDHPATLTTRGNIARWTGDTGDAAGALRLVVLAELLFPLMTEIVILCC